jgi:BlaI family transcriptional regulator, penicillinase repressor
MSDLPNPTPRELQVLKILWRRGPSTVREVYEELRRTESLGQATAQTFLRLMSDKGLVSYQCRGRSFVYTARYSRRKKMAHFLDQVFDGAVDQLLASALSVHRLSDDEMADLEKLIREARRKNK